GVVFYQLLTGRLPFTGENLAAIMYQTMSVDPVPASKFNPRVDKTTLAILKRALEKDKDKRYQSAVKMAEQLRVLSRYRGEDEEAVSLEAKWHPPQHIKLTRAADPSAKRVATRQPAEQTPPNRVKDPLPSDAAHQREPATNVKPDQAKAAGRKVISPRQRRIVLVLVAGLLISIPSLYLWYKSRSAAMQPSNLAAYRIKRKPTPKKVVPAARPVRAPVQVGSETAGPLPADGSKVKTQDVLAPRAVASTAKKSAAERLSREAAEKQKEQERLSREAAEKQKEQERLSREAAEKQKEQERLSREAAEKQKEQERLSREAAEKQKEQERLSRIAEDKRKEQERR
ncbi:MAG: hypothetical protein GY697_20585, partial [Desulfobacterales bacterium]|nr:hypothetical protein [Desulfobacterales bacterium]